ncbi:MAG TPA: hypothetical protein VLE19_01705, partial [Pyrinomonadaceae bacterium]|nr:hypothetical protein [Pyrinomonadaceae bacterium]
MVTNTKSRTFIFRTYPNILWVGLLLILVSQSGAQSKLPTSRELMMTVQEKARVRAPEITGGRGWLNTDKPLSIAALKGKFVLLDFWTYGCINCIHII